MTATVCAGSQAQELEPRSFNNIPINETFLVVGAGRSDGDLSPPGSSPLQDAELTIDALAVGASRTFALAGDSAKVDIVGSRACYEGEGVFMGEFAEGRRCEYADPRFKLTWNFSGAPAMELKEFAGWQQDIVVGASIAVTAPWGDYTSRQLINAGANRWAVKPVVGISHRHGRSWQWEAKLGVTYFQTNDDFFGGTRLEQDPLYSTSLHLIYNLSRGWLSLDANYFAGGRTHVDGVRQNTRQDNSRWGLTWNRPLAPKHLLKLYASTGVVTRIGNDFN
ncbi:transporter, partial [Pseudohalioglobus lutimaris]